MGCGSSKHAHSGGGVAPAPPRPAAQPAMTQVTPPPAPPIPRSNNLPEGWLCQYDPQSQNLFYVNTATHQRQWEHPNGPTSTANDSSLFREQMNVYNQQLANHNRASTPQMSQQQQQQGRSRGGAGVGHVLVPMLIMSNVRNRRMVRRMRR